MCNMMRSSTFKMLTILLAYLAGQTNAYPIQNWPVYPQVPREYDDYYFSPKVQYFYDTPAISVPETHGQIPYPYYFYPYEHFVDNEAPKRQEERLAALPIGQETWFESDATPRWQPNDVDDVNAAFLDNLVLTQMAQDAQRRRENARAAFPDYEEHDTEDEDVRELKALAGKPLYHVPKTVPRFDDDDYVADDGFINWSGNKRSVKMTTTTPIIDTETPKLGDKEVVMPRPAQKTYTHGYQHSQVKRNNNIFYDTITKYLAEKSAQNKYQNSPPARRLEKRFVADDSDLVGELRGLKHHITT